MRNEVDSVPNLVGDIYRFLINDFVEPSISYDNGETGQGMTDIMINYKLSNQGVTNKPGK